MVIQDPVDRIIEPRTSDRRILRDLGDGLVLRRATVEDAEALAGFNACIHSDNGPEKPDELVRAWTLDLASRPHPTFDVGDFTLVEDTRTGKIVSSMNLINQTWSYAGIPFEVGRPELVGTLEEYRNRGLVRAQFEAIHAWSAERGHVAQAITGIPYYYRLFGYEMTINLGGGRVGYKAHLPALKESEKEPFQVRKANLEDIPFIQALYQAGCQRSLVRVEWNEDLWRYELEGKSPKNVNRYEIRILETEAGEPVAFLAHPIMNWGPKLVATTFEVRPGVSWSEVTPTAARYLFKTGLEIAEQSGQAEKFDGFGFWGGAEHPAYEVFGHCLPEVKRPYAWYIRVPDLPGFIWRIAPVLEKRLAESPFAWVSKEIRITFYRSGLRLVLEKGRLAVAETWIPKPVGHEGDVSFPGTTFLQILFGYRSVEELRAAYPDAICNPGFDALLNRLFPKQSSDLWPVA